MYINLQGAHAAPCGLAHAAVRVEQRAASLLRDLVEVRSEVVETVDDPANCVLGQAAANVGVGVLKKGAAPRSRAKANRRAPGFP